MQIEIVVNGKKVMATIDDKDMKEALGEETKKKKKTGYERAERGGKYYLPSFRDDSICNDIESEEPSDNTCYLTAKYYTDKNVARNNERADTLMRKLRRFSAEHGGMPTQTMINEYNYNLDSLDLINSWTIGVRRCPLQIVPVIASSAIGVIGFSSKEAAEQAIEEFKDELLWYFAKYDPMPEGFRDD